MPMAIHEKGTSKEIERGPDGRKKAAAKVNDVAKYLKYCAHEAGVTLSTSLLYFYLYHLQGIHLNYTDDFEAFFEEDIIAGEDGPVIPAVDLEELSCFNSEIFLGFANEQSLLPSDILEGIQDMFNHFKDDKEGFVALIARPVPLNYGEEIHSPYKTTPIGEVISKDDIYEYYWQAIWGLMKMNNDE